MRLFTDSAHVDVDEVVSISYHITVQLVSAGYPVEI